jgi:ABC-type multidrug transport system fused ATPase/permease subunit
VLPLGALVAYGALRLSTTLFTELREFLFARVTQRAVRTIALQVFRHLHALSLRFHLNRQTGGMTRDIERGTRGVSSLISYSLFNDPADPGRDHAGAGLPGAQVRQVVLDHHRGGAGHLHHLHHRRSPNGARTSGAR